MKRDQIIKFVSTYQIPTYALCAMVNDDWEGLSDEDEKNIKEFQDKAGQLCPEGHIYDWPDDVDSDAYFTHLPEFGLATDVVDMRLYKIINNVTLEDANINEKDICSDFDWIADEYVEADSIGDTIHRILFWCHGCICVLKYQMYDNWLSVEIVDDTEGNYDMAYKNIQRKLLECTDASEELYLDRKEENNGYKFMCHFYYIMEVVNGQK